MVCSFFWDLKVLQRPCSCFGGSENMNQSQRWLIGDQINISGLKVHFFPLTTVHHVIWWVKNNLKTIVQSLKFNCHLTQTRNGVIDEIYIHTTVSPLVVIGVVKYTSTHLVYGVIYGSYYTLQTVQIIVLLKVKKKKKHHGQLSLFDWKIIFC